MRAYYVMLCARCPADMDDLLKECFFAAVKTLAVKKSTCSDLFPLLTSTFYRSYMAEMW